MLTLFSTCKPFTGEANVNQRAALQNWASLGLDVIIFGRGEGVAEIAREHGFCYVPDVECNESGIPLIRAMFHAAEKISVNNVLMYTNADVMFHGLKDAVRTVADRLSEFLIVGQRWDLAGTPPMDFSLGWHEGLVERSKLHSPCGVDYFVFTRGLWPDIPPFVVGYPAFDNWLVADALTRDTAVVDATGTISAFHTDHKERYGGKMKQSKVNRKLARKIIVEQSIGHTNCAQWRLVDGVLVRKDKLGAVPHLDKKSSPPPFLTIITRCCKRPAGLARAIESVQTQTDKDFEQVFIVDEVGKGLTWANRQFHEQRMRAEGEYVFVLDDDDVLATPDFVTRLKECAAQWDMPDVILLRHQQLAPTKALLPPPHVWSLNWETGERPTRWAGSVYCFAIRRELWLANAWRFSYGQGEAWHTGGDWRLATALCGWPGLRFIRLDLMSARSFKRGYGKEFEKCKLGWFKKVADRFGIEDRGGDDWRLRYDTAG